VLTDSADVRPNRPGRRVSAETAAQAAAWRWRSQGRRVAILAPLREMETCGCPYPVANAGRQDATHD